jgi:DNA-binding MarR family transcriptional regulator
MDIMMPVREPTPAPSVSACAVTRALLHAAHAVEARLEASLEGAGMSLAKLSVLRHLVEAGEPLALSQLAERSSCVRSNMTQLIDRLEAEGLVRRVSDATDRRSVRALLTRAGQRRHDQAVEILAAREREIVAPLGPAGCAQLVQLLHQLSPER